MLTDRIRPGSNNGTFAGGTTDFTTQFSIQNYADVTYATTFGPALTFTKAVPFNLITTAQSPFTALPGSMKAKFLRHTVVAANGPNPRLADVEFTTVPELANVACLSRYHFSRSFKETYGVGPQRCAVRRRVEHAEAMMRSPASPS